MARRVAKEALIGTAALPAPLGGLNLRDNAAELLVDEASVLKNYIPGETDVRVRGGTSLFATGLGEAPGTLMEWTGPAGRKFFAATADAIHEITSGTPTLDVVTSLTSSRWQTTMFTTAGGSFLVLANGADSVRNYSGGAWTTPTINNVSSSTLNFPFSHKARLWFVANDSTKAWYLATSSIAGDATGFELGEQFRKGGKLLGMGAISRDSGSGPDDLLCFVSSEGEIVVYEGTNPASADSWALVGRYACAPPVNNRSFLSIGGDLKILTKMGVASVAQLMAGGEQQDRKRSVGSKIDPGIAAAYNSNGTREGWQFFDVPRLSLAYINIPLLADKAFQYVAYTGRWSWGTTHDMHAVCWGVFNEQPYFATVDGSVYRAETGFSDHGSVAIKSEVKTSFQSFGPKGRTKEISLVQPLFLAAGLVSPAIRVNVDYQASQPVAADAFQHMSAAVGAYWGYGIWGEARWSGGTGSVSVDQYAATGIGSVAAIHMLTSTTFSTRLVGINLKYKLSPLVTT